MALPIAMIFNASKIKYFSGVKTSPGVGVICILDFFG